jgi:RimJ/RimL family protein N-acetyltransferase
MISMLQIFATHRLLLRPRSGGDFNDCIAMDRDPEVTRFVEGPWSDPPRHLAFVRQRMNTEFGQGYGYWCILSKETPLEFAGWVFLTPFKASPRVAEVGWRLTRSCWGKGFATEAASRILTHAFTTLETDMVVAEIHSDNVASIRVAQKIGMIESGEPFDTRSTYRRYEINNPSRNQRQTDKPVAPPG